MESCGKSTERWRGVEQSVSMEAEGGEQAENKEERGETREVEKETFHRAVIRNMTVEVKERKCKRLRGGEGGTEAVSRR